MLRRWCHACIETAELERQESTTASLRRGTKFGAETVSLQFMRSSFASAIWESTNPAYGSEHGRRSAPKRGQDRFLHKAALFPLFTSQHQQQILAKMAATAMTSAFRVPPGFNLLDNNHFYDGPPAAKLSQKKHLRRSRSNSLNRPFLDHGWTDIDTMLDEVDGAVLGPDAEPEAESALTPTMKRAKTLGLLYSGTLTAA